VQPPPSPDSLTKRGPSAKKNGISDNPVTVKQYYHVRILRGSGDGQDPDRHRILSYKITYSSYYCLFGLQKMYHSLPSAHRARAVILFVNYTGPSKFRNARPASSDIFSWS
jgi:hypothetical protein